MSFKVGDRVLCTVFGEGVVTEVTSDPQYPVRVDFEGHDYGYECYSLSGREYEDRVGAHITLIKNESTSTDTDSKTDRQKRSQP